MNIGALMEEARRMQKKLQEDMESLTVDGASGGGLVKVRMSGLKNVLSVEIDPSLLRESEKAMLEDLVTAACHDASRRCDEALKEKMGPLASGMGLPGMS